MQDEDFETSASKEFENLVNGGYVSDSFDASKTFQELINRNSPAGQAASKLKSMGLGYPSVPSDINREDLERVEQFAESDASRQFIGKHLAHYNVKSLGLVVDTYTVTDENGNQQKRVSFVNSQGLLLGFVYDEKSPVFAGAKAGLEVGDIILSHTFQGLKMKSVRKIEGLEDNIRVKAVEKFQARYDMAQEQREIAAASKYLEEEDLRKYAEEAEPSN